MSYKDTNITNPGTSIKYGADDMEIIARLLNGTTSGPHPVTIKSTNKWGFWDNIMFIRNQADTFSTTLRGAATMTNNFTLALPSQTANDTLPAIGLTNVWSVKQQMESGLVLKQQSSPSNPASTYHHLFMNGSGHLIGRNSSGVEIDYNNQVFAGSASVLRDYSARVFKTGSTYFAYDSVGNIISQGTTFETVAQAALNVKGTVLFAGPDTLTCSAGFSGLSVLETTHVVIERGCTIEVPQSYTGHFMEIADVEKVIIECFGLIKEAGSPARNWNCLVWTSFAAKVMNCHVMHLHVKDCNNAMWIAADGASAEVRNNSFNHVTTENCRRGVLFEVANGGTVNMNMFMDYMITPLMGTTTHGFKDVSGEMNEFHGCMMMDNDGSIVDMNILNSAENTLLMGGNLGILGGATFDDDSLTTMNFNAALQLRLSSGYFKIKNPAGTFATTIANSAITADKTITIPSPTAATDSFALSGIDNIFLEPQTIRKINTENLIILDGNEIKSQFESEGIECKWKSSTGATKSFGRFGIYQEDGTNNSEDGTFFADVTLAGVANQNVFAVGCFGNSFLYWGANSGSAFQHSFQGTGLTASRNWTLPDASTQLVGVGAANIFTTLQTIQRDGATDFLDLYRTDNTATNAVNISFYLEDSTNAKTLYSRIASTIISNTNGSEDGDLQFYTRTNDVLTQKMRIYDTGDLEVSAGRIVAVRDGTPDMLVLYRTDNTATNTADLTFALQDSASNLHNYSRIMSKILVNTNGSEDGALEFWNSNAGTLTRRMSLDDIGQLVLYVDSTNGDPVILYRATNTLNEIQDINFDFNNSVGTEVTYGDFRCTLIEDNNGAEEGRFSWNVMQAGVKEEMMVLTKGKLYVGDAATGTGTVPRVYQMSGTPVNFNNTSAEQTLFTQNIVGGDMGANGMLHLTLLGSLRQNQATATNYTIRVKFGGTTYLEDVFASGITQANVYMPYNIQVWVGNSNATNVQTICMRSVLSDNASTPTTGWGDITDDEIQSGGPMSNQGSQDTTSNKTLAVTMQMSVANAAAEMNVDYKVLVIYPS